MEKTTRLQISDDSGFVAIVNTARYHSFVDQDWEMAQLFHHFVSEMNNEHIIIWATGAENVWEVALLDKPTTQEAFRTFTKTICVTNGQLFLTNYEDLTMAAQFTDEKLPGQHNADLAIPLNNGNYRCTIRQLFDPAASDSHPGDKPHFEIIIQPNYGPAIATDQVYWWAS